jgi:hypothetical protein
MSEPEKKQAGPVVNRQVYTTPGILPIQIEDEKEETEVERLSREVSESAQGFKELYTPGKEVGEEEDNNPVFKVPSLAAPSDKTDQVPFHLYGSHDIDKITSTYEYSIKAQNSIDDVIGRDYIAKIDPRKATYKSYSEAEENDQDLIADTQLVLDYSFKSNIGTFNNDVLRHYVSNDEDFKKVASEFNNSFREKAVAYKDSIAREYGVMDEDGNFDFDHEKAPEVLEKVTQHYYENLFKDKGVAKEVDGFNVALSDYHGQNYSSYNVEEHTPEWIAYADMYNPSSVLGISPTKIWGGIRKIDTGIMKGGLMDVELQQLSYNYELNKEREDRNSKFQEGTQKGVIDKNGIFQPIGKGFPMINPRPGNKLVTWAEAKKMQEASITGKQDAWLKKYDDVIEDMAIDMSYGQEMMGDIFGADGILETVQSVGGMISEQIPQMGSALISYGGIPAVQMMGEDYFLTIQDRAKKKFGVDDKSLTASMVLDIVENDPLNQIGEASEIVGALSGAAEYIGAKGISKTMMGINRLKAASAGPVNSFIREALRGNMTRALKTGAANTVVIGGASLEAGFKEFLTEITQEVLTQAHVGKFDGNRILEAGGMGAVVGFSMPAGKAVSMGTFQEMQSAFNMVRGRFDPMSSEAMYNLFAQDARVRHANGQITEDEYQDILNNLRYVQDANISVPKKVKQDKRLANSWVAAESTKLKLGAKLAANKESSEEIDVSDTFGFSAAKKAVRSIEKIAGVLDFADQSVINQLKNRVNKLSKMNFEEQGLSALLMAAGLESNVDNITTKNATRFSKIFNNTLKVAKSLGVGKDRFNVVGTYTQAAEIILEEQGIVKPKSNASKKQKQDYFDAVQAQARKMRGTKIITNEDGKTVEVIDNEGTIVDGFFTSKGQQYLISEAVNDAEFNTDVAAHELQHHIWEKTINDDQAVVDKIYFATRDALIDLSRQGKIKGDVASVLKRLEEVYKVKDNISKRDELLNIIGDAFKIGEESVLAWDENSLQKVGRAINEWFGKTYNTSVNLDTGEDVINWIIGYKRNIRRGRVGAGTIKAFTEGFTGKLTKGTQGPKYTPKYAESVLESKRQGPTVDQKRVSEEMQAIWNEKGQDGVWEIYDYESSPGQKYWPNVIRGILKKYNYYERPNARRYEEEVIAEAMTNWNQKNNNETSGVQGVLGLLMNYDPSKNDSIAAYVNTYLGLNITRNDKYGFINKILQADVGRGFESNIDDVYDLSIEESSNVPIGETMDASSEEMFSKLRTVLGFDEQQMNMVRRAVMDAVFAVEEAGGKGSFAQMAESNPLVLRNYMKKVFIDYLYKYLLNEVVGTKQGYREFLDNAYHWIPKIFDLRTLTNRKITPFYEKVVDPKTGKVQRYNVKESLELMLDNPKAGSPKTKIKKPTYQEFKNWYNGVGMSQNVWFERKKSIVQAMAETLGFDATLEVLQNPDQSFFTKKGKSRVEESINMFDEVIGKGSENLKANQVVARIGRIINRDPNVRFSSRMSPRDAAEVLFTEDPTIAAKVDVLQEAIRGMLDPSTLQTMATHSKVDFSTRMDIRDYVSGVLKNNIEDIYGDNFDPRSIKYIADKAANFVLAMHVNNKQFNFEQNEAVRKKYVNNVMSAVVDVAKNRLFNKGLDSMLQATNVSSALNQVSTPAKQKWFNTVTALSVAQPLLNAVASYLENVAEVDNEGLNFDLANEVLKIKIATENILSSIFSSNNELQEAVSTINNAMAYSMSFDEDIDNRDNELTNRLGYVSRQIASIKYESEEQSKFRRNFHALRKTADGKLLMTVSGLRTATANEVDMSLKAKPFSASTELSTIYSDAKALATDNHSYVNRLRDQLVPYNHVLTELVEKIREDLEGNDITYENAVQLLQQLDSSPDLLKLAMVPIAIQSDVDFKQFNLGEDSHIVYRTGPISDEFIEDNNREGHFFAKLPLYSDNYRVMTENDVLRNQKRSNQRDKTEAYVVTIKNPFFANDRLSFMGDVMSGKVSLSRMQEEGYDGVIYTGVNPSNVVYLPGQEMAAFSEKQVQKVTGAQRTGMLNQFSNESVIPAAPHNYMMSALSEYVMQRGYGKNPLNNNALGASIVVNKKFKTRLEADGYLKSMPVTNMSNKMAAYYNPLNRFISMKPLTPSSTKPGFQSSSNDFYLYNFDTGNFDKTLNIAALNEHTRTAEMRQKLDDLSNDLKESKRKKKSSDEKKAREKANKQTFKRKKKYLTPNTVDKLKDMLGQAQEEVRGKALTPEEQAKVDLQEQMEREAAELNKQFNDIIEEVFGIDSDSIIDSFSAAENRRNISTREILPPSADDFFGLIENYLVGRGEQGEKHLSFFYEYVFEPLMLGNLNYDSERIRLLKEFSNVMKMFKATFSHLKREAVTMKRKDGKTLGYSGESVLRAFIFDKLGHDTGLEESVLKEFNAYVVRNPELRSIANEVIRITATHKYAAPKADWWLGSLQGDILEALKTNSRKKYYEEFTRNIEILFNNDNLNKLTYSLGYKYTAALKDSIRRIKSGSNRSGDLSKYEAAIFDFFNGAAGVVMFGNVRSAVLQLLSFTNYIEFGDNNAIAAAKSFANFDQYTKDFLMIMNSDFLLARRNGLQIDINEAELMDKTKNAKNRFSALLAVVLSKGYVFTKYGDSMAIAMGGASYYRNKVNAYLMAETGLKGAELDAFVDKLEQGRSRVKQLEQQAKDVATQIKDLKIRLSRAKQAVQNGNMTEKDVKQLRDNVYKLEDQKQTMSQSIAKARELIADDEQTIAESESKAFRDFMFKTNESQQSSRPERISQEQATRGGRFFLMFANTQMQYSRVMKKVRNRIKKGIGNKLENFARYGYYAVVAHALFNAVQQLTFLVPGIGDDDEEREKYAYSLNNYSDSLLRGLGLRGQYISFIKNFILSQFDVNIITNADPKARRKPLIEGLTKIAPPLDAKYRRVKQLEYFRNKAMQKYKQGYDLDQLGPEYMEMAIQALAIANIPADRVRQLAQNYYNVFDMSADYQAHHRLLMFLGWPDYQIPGAPDSEEAREPKVTGKGGGRREVKRGSTKRRQIRR